MYLLQIEQKFVAMSLISSAVFQRIFTKSGMGKVSGSESNLAKSEFENSKRLPWKLRKKPSKSSYIGPMLMTFCM